MAAEGTGRRHVILFDRRPFAAVGRKKRLEIRDDTTLEDSKQNAVGRKHSFWMRDQR